MEPTTTQTSADPAAEQISPDPLDDHDRGLVEDELLVEEISIDGMCGVY